jgi:hypothetical protein
MVGAEHMAEFVLETIRAWNRRVREYAVAHRDRNRVWGKCRPGRRFALVPGLPGLPASIRVGLGFAYQFDYIGTKLIAEADWR